MSLTRLFLAICLIFSSYNAYSNESIYLDQLDKEINNRAFAFKFASSMPKYHINTIENDFWWAYLELETLSKEKYSEVMRRHHIEPNSLVVYKKSMFSKLMMSIFTQTFYEMMHEATKEYSTQLESIRTTCPEDDTNFCEYAIAQEKLQARAMKYVVDGDFSSATSLIKGFIALSR